MLPPRHFQCPTFIELNANFQKVMKLVQLGIELWKMLVVWQIWCPAWTRNLNADVVEPWTGLEPECPGAGEYHVSAETTWSGYCWFVVFERRMCERGRWLESQATRGSMYWGVNEGSCPLLSLQSSAHIPQALHGVYGESLDTSVCKLLYCLSIRSAIPYWKLLKRLHFSEHVKISVIMCLGQRFICLEVDVFLLSPCSESSVLVIRVGLW